MTTSIAGGGNTPRVAPLPAGDTVVPGLGLTWSQVMLLLTQGPDAAGDLPAGQSGLELPAPGISVEGVTAELQAAQEELSNGMATNQKDMLKLHREQRKESSEAAIKSLKEFADQIAQSLEDQKKQSVDNWVKAIFGLIGAVFAAVAVTALSGGAAVAAGVAAVAGAVMAVMDVVDQSMKAAGKHFTGPDGKPNLGFSIQGIVQAAVETACKDGSVPQDQVADVTAKATAAVNGVLTGLILICSLGGASGIIRAAAGAIKDVVTGARTVGSLVKDAGAAVKDGAAGSSGTRELVATTVTVTADLTGSGATIAAGALEIHTAGVERAAADSKALADLMNAVAATITTFITAEGNNLTTAVKGLNDMLGSLSDMVRDYFEAQGNITSSMA